MKQKKSTFHPVEFLALVPIVSIGLLILLMRGGFAEGITLVGTLALVVCAVLWGVVGAIFSRAHMTFWRATLEANLIPLLSALAYTVLRVIAMFSDSQALVDSAELVGGLGMGVLTLFSSLLFSIIPLELYEVYLNLVFCLIVFGAGFAIGSARREKRIG